MKKQKRKKILKYNIPIFTEYAVKVYIAKVEDLIKPTAIYCELPEADVKTHIERSRACCWGTLENIQKQPLITINSEIDIYTAFGSISHEASHAMDFISNYIQIDDKNGEFKAHGIGLIVGFITSKLLHNRIK